MNWHDHIVSDPNTLSGRLRIKGLVAAGYDVMSVALDCPAHLVRL
jgi:uncharacterized protein (DUF433 family)